MKGYDLGNRFRRAPRAMMQIFLSHSGADHETAGVLSSALESQGHTVWRYADIPAGSSLRNHLDKALRSADVVVSLITENSSSSRWVQSETSMALAYARETGRMLVIPVILGEARIPVLLENIQAIVQRDGDVEAVAQEVLNEIDSWWATRLADRKKQEEALQRIEGNAGSYVEVAISVQEEAGARYRRIGIAWYGVGLVALVIGLVFIGLNLGQPTAAGDDWSAFALAALRAVIIIGLLGAVTKYSFTLGKSFTVESLKCSDRIHAIRFGKFYLDAFGQDAQWAEVKEAFANWNIDRPSAFSTTSVDDFDPKVVELLRAAFDAVNPVRKA
jgi:hypothetical protein